MRSRFATHSQQYSDVPISVNNTLAILATDRNTDTDVIL